jgi:hypothetical protein
MSEVFQVLVPYESPSSRYPAGKSALGHYIITDGVLTLTDKHGVVATDAEGKEYSEKLEPTDSPQTIGGRLTMKLRAALRGDRPKGFGGSGSGFNRELIYPKSGIY